MTMPFPQVTIGLPIYNAEKTLAKTIASILQQTFSDWELLLLDDGSSDSSLEIAAGFSDPRIRLVSDGENKGISFRLNQAVSMAQGRYFCRMDADDVCFPQRIQKQWDFMESHPGNDLVAGSIVTFDQDGILGGIVQIDVSHRDICRHPWNGFHFPHPTWFGRIDWFRAHPYSSHADGSEDQLLLYENYLTSTYAGIPDVLLCYRDVRSSFGKMLSRRICFWRAIGRSALQKGNFLHFFLLCLVQPAKIVADFLYIKLGFSWLRNKRTPVNAFVADIWRTLGRD